MEFKVVIPARYASSRLPGKALLKIKGKPIIQYVHENAVKSGAEQIIIATDDQRILECAQEFNADVCLTSSQHKSGTDRIAEVAQKNTWADDVLIVNVQGDEPLMPAENIRQVAENLNSQSDVKMSTLCTSLYEEEYKNTNIVKVVRDENNIAIKFSRNTRSFDKEFHNKNEIYRHLGIYSYSVGFLHLFTQLPQSKLEKLESLEQMRALEHGHAIHVDLCKSPTGIGVDTQDDYEKLLTII